MNSITILLFSISFFLLVASGHIHENLLPKGWGDVENITATIWNINKLTHRNTDKLSTYFNSDNATFGKQEYDDSNKGSYDPDKEKDDDDDDEETLGDILVEELNTNITKSDVVNLTRRRQQQPRPQESSTKNQNESKQIPYRFVWKVYNFSELLCNGQELVFSPRFYLTDQVAPVASGYRLQLLLVTNTTYSDMVSYLGVFFRIVAGDYDAGLEWPFKFRTELAVIQHSQLEAWKLTNEELNATSRSSSEWNSTENIFSSKYTHTVVPNIDECRLRSAFLRPNSDVDTGANTDGCGNRRHIPLSQLESDRYLRDDTLLIMITVITAPDDAQQEKYNFRKATMSMRYNELVSNYWWNVESFSARKNESVQSDKIVVLTSSPFYTHTNGYLLQLFLTILPKRNAFAVSIAFMQGDHDRYLQWPFPYSFEMAIVDQSPGKHLSKRRIVLF